MWTSHPAVAWLWSAAGGMGGLIAPPGPQGSGGASLGPFAVAGSVICPLDEIWTVAMGNL